MEIARIDAEESEKEKSRLRSREKSDASKRNTEETGAWIRAS